MHIKGPVFYSVHIDSQKVILEDQEALHCAKVLRMQPGEVLFATNGSGLWVKAQITSISKQTVDAQILESEILQIQEKKITVYIAPPKQTDRMDYVVEKLTELGADYIYLVQTTRTERSRLDIEKLKKKTIAALKQSKRAQLPQLAAFSSVKEAWQKSFGSSQVSHAVAYVDEENKPFITTLKPAALGMALWIGPEGDFTSEEIQFLIAKGAQGVSLGQQILRTDTAAIAGTAYLYHMIRE